MKRKIQLVGFGGYEVHKEAKAGFHWPPSQQGKIPDWTLKWVEPGESAMITRDPHTGQTQSNLKVSPVSESIFRQAQKIWEESEGDCPIVWATFEGESIVVLTTVLDKDTS